MFVSLLVAPGPTSASHTYVTGVADHSVVPKTTLEASEIDVTVQNNFWLLIHAVDMFGTPSPDVDKFRITLRDNGTTIVNGGQQYADSIPIQSGDVIDGVTFINDVGLYKAEVGLFVFSSFRLCLGSGCIVRLNVASVSRFYAGLQAGRW